MAEAEPFRDDPDAALRSLPEPVLLDEWQAVPEVLGAVELALAGGYPEPVLRLQGGARERWLESYLGELFTRDAVSLNGPRNPELLRRYFEALAVNTAGIAAEKTVYDAASISRPTAAAYEQLLRNLFVLDSLPAWSTNRLSRLVKAPKRYLTDTSLLTAALHLDELAVMRDGNLLGRLIETYVLAQIRPELELAGFTPRLYHLREKNGRHEIRGSDLASSSRPAFACERRRPARRSARTRARARADQTQAAQHGAPTASIAWASVRPRPRAAPLIAYFDTSAPIKLIFAEEGSDLARELWDRADLVASSQLVYPEARAAAALACRMGRIRTSTLRRSVRAIDDLHAELRVIGLDGALARSAGELAELHSLRGYDAVHLASAISVEDAGLLTVTWDHDLADAAVACGYMVAPASP